LGWIKGCASGDNLKFEQLGAKLNQAFGAVDCRWVLGDVSRILRASGRRGHRVEARARGDESAEVLATFLAVASSEGALLARSAWGGGWAEKVRWSPARKMMCRLLARMTSQRRSGAGAELAGHE